MASRRPLQVAWTITQFAGLYRPGQIVSAFVNVDLFGGTIIEGHVGEDFKPVGLDDAIVLEVARQVLVGAGRRERTRH